MRVAPIETLHEMIVRMALLLCLLAPASGAVAATEVYHTAAQADSAPKYLTLAGGKTGGICVDLFRRMEAWEPALRIAGDQTTLPLKRLTFKIGDGDWKDTSMVADEVNVQFKLALTGVGKL